LLIEAENLRALLSPGETAKMHGLIFGSSGAWVRLTERMNTIRGHHPFLVSRFLAIIFPIEKVR
jgi:hypothetical protein